MSSGYSCPRCSKPALWFRARADGGPDRRFNDNRLQCPYCGWDQADGLTAQERAKMLAEQARQSAERDTLSRAQLQAHLAERAMQHDAQLRAERMRLESERRKTALFLMRSTKSACGCGGGNRRVSSAMPSSTPTAASLIPVYRP